MYELREREREREADRHVGVILSVIGQLSHCHNDSIVSHIPFSFVTFSCIPRCASMIFDAFTVVLASTKIIPSMMPLLGHLCH